MVHTGRSWPFFDPIVAFKPYRKAIFFQAVKWCFLSSSSKTTIKLNGMLNNECWNIDIESFLEFIQLNWTHCESQEEKVMIYLNFYFMETQVKVLKQLGIRTYSITLMLFLYIDQTKIYCMYANHSNNCY